MGNTHFLLAVTFSGSPLRQLGLPALCCQGCPQTGVGIEPALQRSPPQPHLMLPGSPCLPGLGFPRSSLASVLILEHVHLLGCMPGLLLEIHSET